MNNSRNLRNLNISLINNENVQIGCNNTLVVVRGIEDDIPKNNNNTPHISEVRLRSGDEKSLKYKSSGPTCISIGNNCTIAELVLNKELLDELRTGKFTVTKGENLLSITWCDDNLYQSEQVPADHIAIKIRFSEDQDIQELEKQVFELLADCKDKKLVQLITELLNNHKARLKHIKMGCIELEIDLQSDSSVNLLDRKEQIKDLLRRTIIPEGAMFDIELLCPSPRANEGQATSKNFQNQNKNDVTIRRTIIPEGAMFDIELLCPSPRANKGQATSENFQNQNKGDNKDDQQDSAPESNKGDYASRYKIPEDKKTVDLMEPSSSLLSDNNTQKHLGHIDVESPLKQVLNKSLDEVSKRCKTVIDLELKRHFTSEERPIFTRDNKSKNKINIHKIFEKLDTEFKQFLIDLEENLQLNSSKYESRRYRYKEVVTTGKTVCKHRSSVQRELTTLENTTFPETKTETSETGSSEDITGIIINKIEEQFQVTTDGCREKIKFIIEGQGEEIPKWENKEDKTEPEMKSEEFENLLAAYNMTDDWLQIQQYFDQKVEKLKPEMDQLLLRNERLSFNTESQNISTSDLHSPRQRRIRQNKCVIM